MLGTCKLYKLKLTMNDTMYFSDVDQQKDFFEGQPHLTLNNVSFNGSRDFRINQNYLNLLSNEYNYCSFEFNNYTQYFYINDFVYINDNTTAVDVTIDTIQTFMFDIIPNVKDSVVKNLTLKNSDFNKYIPYTNKVKPESFDIKKIGDFDNVGIAGSTIHKLGGIIVNYTDNTKPYQYYDNGFLQPFHVICFPILYNTITKEFEHIEVQISENGENYSTIPKNAYQQFLNNKGSYILNGAVSLVFDLSFIVTARLSTSNQLYVTINTGAYIDYNSHYIYVLKSRRSKWGFNIDKYIPARPFARQPYFSVIVGNATENVELNLLDFFDKYDMEDRYNDFRVETFTSYTYPCSTQHTFFLNNEKIKDALFMAITAPTEAPPYNINAWQDYCSRNTASVNDGLATKHKYDAKISTNEGVSTIINGALQGTAETIGGFVTLDPTKAVGGAVKGMATMLGGVTKGAYIIENADLKIQQEKALQEISWNDIKSSPSVSANFSATLAVKYAKESQSTAVYISKAKNLNDIIRYHTMLGYAIHRVERQPLLNLKRHINFDYISFDNLNFAAELPFRYLTEINRILMQGIRFWYNYDNFLNFKNNYEV